MRISPVGAPEALRGTRRAFDEAEAHEGDASASRALVAIEPAAPHLGTRSATRHPVAPFLAQLIATHLQLPQTRERRRAEPAEAIAAYRSMQTKLN